MKTYEFVYEDEYGDVCNYVVRAKTRRDAEKIVREECPDAIDAGLEVNEID